MAPWRANLRSYRHRRRRHGVGRDLRVGAARPACAGARSSSEFRMSWAPRRAQRASFVSLLSASGLVPLMRLSFTRWQALERDFGERLLTVTGGLDIGLPSGRVVAGAKPACRERRLARGPARKRGVAAPSRLEAASRVRSGAPARSRVPPCRPRHRRAHNPGPHPWGRRAGKRASTRIGRRWETTSRWKPSAAVTRRARSILAAGAWTGKLLGRLGPVRFPSARSSAGSRPAGPSSRRARFRSSSSIARNGELSTAFRSPSLAKASRSASFAIATRTSTPMRSTRRVTSEDEAVLTWMGRYLADPLGPPVGFKTCMFVNSPDEHLIR